MKRLLRMQSDQDRWFCFDAGEWSVHIRFDAPKELAARLDEAKQKGKSLGGKYSAHVHSKHWDGGQKHLHVYAKQKQIFALNQDGTAHDASHNVEIPKVAADGIRKLFPDFVLPSNNVIEWASPGDVRLLLG